MSPPHLISITILSPCELVPHTSAELPLQHEFLYRAIETSSKLKILSQQVLNTSQQTSDSSLLTIKILTFFIHSFLNRWENPNQEKRTRQRVGVFSRKNSGHPQKSNPDVKSNFVKIFLCQYRNFLKHLFFLEYSFKRNKDSFRNGV